ncbi:uncharacterized protein LOC116258088 [Nymphaea colorata]|nr:uncharacterized protein LOC116258088 [Nymphaea colorata]
MDFELRAAREKLEREQRQRKEKARLKLERERRAKAEAARQRDALEAAQRARRIEAAQAQIVANQQMEENLRAGNGVIFYRIFEAAPYQGYGDKIKLPPSCFSELSDQGALDKGPMFFQLLKIYQGNSEALSSADTKHEDNRTTHCGVLEFTAAEGSVELPPHIWTNLFPIPVDNTPLIEVRYVRLPKGTYAKLQPDTIGFSDIPNHKAVLETSLRQHATLSQGDILTVNHGGLSYKLKVLELKPSSSVSVLETDVEVDIVEPSSTSESVDQPLLNALVLGKVESGTVEEGRYEYYKFSIGDNVISKLSNENVVVEVKLDVEINSGDTDLYVSRHPVLFPSKHQHEWSSHDVGSKVLILGGDNKELTSGTYSIGIFGFKGSSKYHVSVSLQEKLHQRHGERAVSSTSADKTDCSMCSNCHHYIPTRTIALHEAYCSRHNVVCPQEGCGVVLRKDEARSHVHCTKCGKALHREEMEKHMKVFHEPLYCACGVSLEQEAMVIHQSSVCPLRLITCRYCGDMVPAGTFPSDVRDRMRGLSEHESVCGSRTAPCDSCGRSVMLKDMEIHRIAVHQKN